MARTRPIRVLGGLLAAGLSLTATACGGESAATKAPARPSRAS
jgi:hypothetical protein